MSPDETTLTMLIREGHLRLQPLRGFSALLSSLFWTFRVLWCSIRGGHGYDAWPQITIQGVRTRPYRQCTKCRATWWVGSNVIERIKGVGAVDPPTVEEILAFRAMRQRRLGAPTPGT
jgi:hypothetical protein